MKTKTTNSDTTQNENIIESDVFPIISESIQTILDAFPQPTALLNLKEKVLTVNINFLKLFSYTSSEYLIGKRPEDIFHCIYANDKNNHSQTADQCRKCGENLEVKESKVSCNRFTERCHLTFVDETRHFDDFHNMKVNKSPFKIGSRQL